MSNDQRERGPLARMRGTERGPVMALLHPFVLAALGVALSVGVAYATVGGAIQANAKDIEELRALTVAIGHLQVKQATADSERENMAGDISRLLSILERRYGTPPKGAAG